MSNLRKEAEKKSKTTKKEDKRDQTEVSSHSGETNSEENMAAVLTELRNLRREHAEALQDTKTTLARVESTLDDVLERTTKLEHQVTALEQRVSDTDDRSLRHERAIRHLLHRDAIISAKCEDIESRARRNNMRIYGVKESEERNDMINFITELMHTSFELTA